MRRSLPPSFWLVLAGLCFAGALASWPRPQIRWTAHEAAGAPPAAPEFPSPPAVTEDPIDAGASHATAPRQIAVPSLPDLPDETADAAAAAGPPQAGRQVLRCVERGRTVYRDAGGICAEGVGEPVTLFPTRGVEAPR